VGGAKPQRSPLLGKPGQWPPVPAAETMNRVFERFSRSKDAV
jgi:hypothetical protein